MRENIVLIGMPGAGKSTVGVVLAKRLGYDFIDSDLLIQKARGELLSNIIEKYGIEEFIRIEDQVNASIDVENTVIATGGSVVYGERAMKHLSEIGRIVYLKLPFEELEGRLGSLQQRGVVLREGQTLRELYDERCVLYERYAHITVEEDQLDINETVMLVMDKLNTCE